ncbi:hypothetical protein GCM10029976_022310 [Kribbella albertanoniae]
MAGAVAGVRFSFVFMATLFFAGALRVVFGDSLVPEALFLAAVLRTGADFLGAVAMGSYPLFVGD